MKKTALWTLLTFGAFLIQTQLSALNVPVNLTAVLVYLFGLKNLERVSTREYFGSRTEILSTLFGAAVGIAEDAVTGSPIGPNFLSKGLIGFAVPIIFTDVVFGWTRFWGTVIIISLTLFDGFAVTASRVLFSDMRISALHVFGIMVLQAVINIPFGMTLKPRVVK